MKLLRNRMFLALIAILLAAGICFGLAPSINKMSNNQTQIVRAIKSIPEGTAVTGDMIQTVSVGSFNLPENILKSPENVIGKYTTAELDPGDYILSSKISNKSQSPYLSNLDGKQQAISISIKSFSAGLSGKLQSGDVISLIVSNYGSAKQVVAPPELKYVKLLAATTAQGTDTDQVQKKGSNDTSSQGQNIPATLTLLVNPQQATKLVDYETNGSLYATLVFRGSEDAAKKYLDIQSSYFLTQESGAQMNNTQPSNAPSSPSGAGVSRRMENKQIIAVWGSPGSGTTLTAVKIARELASRKKSVVLILGDAETPAVPLIIPQADAEKSLGHLLSLPTITQIDIFRHCIPVGNLLSIMGYMYGENEKTYPDYSDQRARELIDLLRNSADYTVIDCPHHLLSSILTAVSLEKADQVFRVVNADIKSIVFLKSQRPFLAESRFRWDDHISIINNVLYSQDSHTYEETFGGKAYTLPHLPALQEQYDSYRLLEPVTGREGKLYEPPIRAIVKEEILNE